MVEFLLLESDDFVSQPVFVCLLPLLIRDAFQQDLYPSAGFVVSLLLFGADTQVQLFVVLFLVVLSVP